jgi:hypothetical protein
VNQPHLLRDALYLAAAMLLGAGVVQASHLPDGSQAARDLIARIDGDGDARLGPSEVARVDDGALPFAVLDLDRSGWLEPWEVDAMLHHLSPMAWGMGATVRVR